MQEITTALESSTAQAQQAESAYEAASKEISEVKQRARALLEEKDLQLQAARVRIGSDPVRVLPYSLIQLIQESSSNLNGSNGTD